MLSFVLPLSAEARDRAASKERWRSLLASSFRISQANRKQGKENKSKFLFFYFANKINSIPAPARASSFSMQARNKRVLSRALAAGLVPSSCLLLLLPLLAWVRAAAVSSSSQKHCQFRNIFPGFMLLGWIIKLWVGLDYYFFLFPLLTDFFFCLALAAWLVVAG